MASIPVTLKDPREPSCISQGLRPQTQPNAFERDNWGDFGVSRKRARRVFMNPIRSFSLGDSIHAIQPGAQGPLGSVMEVLAELQHLLPKEAREERQLQEQARAQELQQQEQARQGNGFFKSIGNFLTGNDGGSGIGFASPDKVEQSSLAWNDWKKFLKLH